LDQNYGEKIKPNENLDTYLSVKLD